MAIIGISGKINSGKDTVGKMIQVICYLDKINIPWSMAAFEHNHNTNFTDRIYYGDWHIKKFAYKLKQVVALLTGCKVEDLENQEFKNSYLPEEWNQFVKVEFPEYEEAKLTGEHIANSDSLLVRTTHRRMTYREMLQKVGTEAMRNNIHENVWVTALFADYKDLLGGAGMTDHNLTIKYPNWIITDMRFPNEMVAVEKRGGITIRIDRKCDFEGPLSTHPSETSLDDHTFKHVIENDGSIEDLVQKVRQILITEKIIK